MKSRKQDTYESGYDYVIGDEPITEDAVKSEYDAVSLDVQPDDGEYVDDVVSKPTLPKITLKVFRGLSGKKPDQMAGFVAYAKNKFLEPMTIPQWHEKFYEFQNKPTR